MAVSKHNFWKRKKNGIMKLVRSHSDWLERQRETKMRKLGSKRADTPVEDSRWRQKEKANTSTGRTKPVVSTKRTQIGKKVKKNSYVVLLNSCIFIYTNVI